MDLARIRLRRLWARVEVREQNDRRCEGGDYLIEVKRNDAENRIGAILIHLAIGISIILGLSLDLLPTLFVGVPTAVRPLFESSLTLSTVMAVVLNQILRMGEVAKTT